MSENLNDLTLTELAAPIAGGSGEDLSFSNLLDQIKEARRADPDYLTQGDWQTDLKVSDWDRTVELARSGLVEQSKDLMLCAWLAEGLAHTCHFPGIAFGLRLTQRLLEDFWPTLYPALEEGLDLRITRLTWINTSLAEVIGSLPITLEPGYGLARYEESKYVENLALQNTASMANALNEGKINAEIFQRSAVLTPTEHLQLRLREISDSLQACAGLQATMNHLLDQDAPSFTGLEDTLQRAYQLVEKLLKDRGIESVAASGATDATPLSIEAVSTRVHDAGPAMSLAMPNSEALRTMPMNREEAFTMLSGVAQYFKQAEPQSPVPYLIERAIKWGNMPLESWLADVIKDASVVDSIKDMLGTSGA